MKYFTFIENVILDEMLAVIIILGAILISFSKTESENEFISKIGYESLVWATYLNFGLMLLITIFILWLINLINPLAMTNNLKVLRAIKNISQEELENKYKSAVKL